MITAFAFTLNAASVPEYIFLRKTEQIGDAISIDRSMTIGIADTRLDFLLQSGHSPAFMPSQAAAGSEHRAVNR